MDIDLERDLDLDRERDLDLDLERERDLLEALGAGGGVEGGVLDFEVFVLCLLEDEDEDDLDLAGGGERGDREPRGAGERLRGERERALGAGLRGERERRGERDAERPRERERERDELSDRERLLDLFALFASMSLIFLPLISFPDSFSRAFFRSL